MSTTVNDLFEKAMLYKENIDKGLCDLSQNEISTELFDAYKMGYRQALTDFICDTLKLDTTVETKDEDLVNFILEEKLLRNFDCDDIYCEECPLKTLCNFMEEYQVKEFNHEALVCNSCPLNDEDCLEDHFGFCPFIMGFQIERLSPEDDDDCESCPFACDHSDCDSCSGGCVACPPKDDDDDEEDDIVDDFGRFFNSEEHEYKPDLGNTLLNILEDANFVCNPEETVSKCSLPFACDECPFNEDAFLDEDEDKILRDYAKDFAGNFEKETKKKPKIADIHLGKVDLDGNEIHRDHFFLDLRKNTAHLEGCKDIPKNLKYTAISDSLKEIKADGFNLCPHCFSFIDRQLIGNKKSHIVHMPDCYILPENPDREVRFDSLQDALDQGYRTCSYCFGEYCE